MKQSSTLRIIDQDSAPQSRSVPIRFGRECLYVEPRTKEAFEMWRDRETNYTRNSDALNDRLKHSLTVSGYLQKNSPPYQTQTHITITAEILAAIKQIQNIRSNLWKKESSEQEILEMFVKEALMGFIARSGLSLEEAEELSPAPVED